ncbi:hypothetical protein N7527_006597 [Penicillium freii]|nr:hypothetical protein N7527_006597 [Penicillium freii]
MGSASQFGILIVLHNHPLQTGQCGVYVDLSGQFHFFSGYWSAKKTVTWRISAYNRVRVLNLGYKQLALEPDLYAYIRWPKKQYIKPRGYKIFLSS